jgi:hypothetical protein
LFLDNLGCVSITGGVVPEFAVGSKRWGEYVTGGSPNPALQSLALRLCHSQLDGGFLLQAAWLPREQNVRADYLSRVSEMRHHDYSLLRPIFRQLDDAWGPHSIDRFACAGNSQTLRFCSHYFHPEAEWVDAFSSLWTGGNNWLSPLPLQRQSAERLPRRSHRHVKLASCPLVPLALSVATSRLLGPVHHDGPPARPPASCLHLPPRYRDLSRLSSLRAPGGWQACYLLRRHPRSRIFVITKPFGARYWPEAQGSPEHTNWSPLPHVSFSNVSWARTSATFVRI